MLDGGRGDDKDPCSTVLEISANGKALVHTPPNRALAPTGGYVDFASLLKGTLEDV